MTAIASPAKCPECGQKVMPARALAFGEWVPRLFTARPAIVYTVDDSDYVNEEGAMERKAVRYRPDLHLYLYHEAVCPRRQLRQVVGADVAKCRSCPAAVTWVRSPAGALLPLDYEPVTVYEIDQELLIGRNVMEHFAPAPLFLSHWASCAHPEQHKKARR